MDPRYQPTGKAPEVSRRTLRLTFKSSEDGIELISVEHLAMITPPQPGERPEAGRNGGHWFELRDGRGRVLAHRLIDPSVLNSVEVHSPDGRIQREFGAIKSGVFEVLLPDVDGAHTAVLVGDPLKPSRTGPGRAESSGDVATFELFPGREGGNR
jgi:hypothetical protein